MAGLVWLTMAGQGGPWHAMADLVWPGPAMAVRNYMAGHGGPYGRPWLAMVGRDQPWLAMAGHGWPWPAMADHGWPWPTMKP